MYGPHAQLQQNRDPSFKNVSIATVVTYVTLHIGAFHEAMEPVSGKSSRMGGFWDSCPTKKKEKPLAHCNATIPPYSL